MPSLLLVIVTSAAGITFDAQYITSEMTSFNSGVSPFFAIIYIGQELTVKPFSLVSTNRNRLGTVVLKEDLQGMKVTP